MFDDVARSLVINHWPDGESVCAGCRGSRWRVLGWKNGYELMECRGCGNVSARVKPGQSARQEIYQHYYDNASFETPLVTAASLDQLVASFEPFRSTGRLIDVGFGEGAMLNAAERRGWTCYGTEIDFRALDYGRRRGWVVGVATARDERFPAHDFDVVTMIEFLEHVPDPEPFLKAALDLLRPEGILYLTTPNGQSLNSLLLGLQWSVVCPPDHLTIWTTRGLRMALSRAGFMCRRIRREGLNPCEVICHLRDKNEMALINRQKAAVNLNSGFSRSRVRQTVKKGINRILSTFGAGDTIKVWATPRARPGGRRLRSADV
jgi:SAM-dependent methyltransferase